MSRLILKGLPVSAGLSIAPVFRLETVSFEVLGRQITPEKRVDELNRLEKARKEVASVIQELGPDSDRKTIIDMLKDPLFRGSIVDRIQSGRTAEDAVIETSYDLQAIFGELADPLMRIRADQVGEVARFIVRRLHGFPVPLFSPESPVIIATPEMSAFDAALLQPGTVAGVVCTRGGTTSHFAIITKQAGIPVVSGIDRVMDLLVDGEECVCDGTNGMVYARPDQGTIQVARKRINRERITSDRLGGLARVRTVTRDRRPVGLWGNIAGPDDVPAILSNGGKGVGLFRTEFIYQGDEAPSEERQAYLYADILRQVPGPVVMRTLEAGGDKTIPYLAGEPEENPNLGWQGLRMCLDTPDLFLTQLRAMIRASSEGDLWIMFPFVSARWELDICRRLVAEADTAVRRDGITPGPYKVGIMVEVPSAAIMAREYLNGFDFCSIGTNDLTQFTLAADRMNPRVARWYDPLHPAVLRLIALTAQAAQKAAKPIGMAGDMAGDPLVIPLLIGMGFTSLSVTAPRIPEAKKTILNTHSHDARQMVRQVLVMPDAESIRTYLTERMNGP